MSSKPSAAIASPAQIRARAARIVAAVADQGKSLDGLLAELSGAPAERGLTRTLVYGAIRWHIRLSAVLSELSTKSIEQLDPAIRSLLIVGLYQLLHTDIAAHAAVAETVEATRVLRQPKAAGFVNAILRRCQRESAAIVTRLDGDIAVRTAHPAWLVRQLERDWPEVADILAANNAHPPMWLRVNTRRTTTQDYLARLVAAGIAAQVSDIVPTAIVLTTPCDVQSLPDFALGHVSVQDAAAQCAASLLATQPGHRVLDACAAPGGKAMHILESQPQLSELVALDVSAARLRKVQQNLDRLQLRATLLAADASEPQAWWDGRPFDRILIDAPCSGTGVIRRHPDIKLLRRPSDVPALRKQQRGLLEGLWPLLASGGRLVYATCSALRAENSEVIAAFLGEHQDARDVTAAEVAMRFPGLPPAKRADCGYAIAAGQAQMDGFYYACLDKISG